MKQTNRIGQYRVWPSLYAIKPNFVDEPTEGNV